MAVRRSGVLPTSGELAELNALIAILVHHARDEYGDQRLDRTIVREILRQIKMVDLTGPLQRLRQMVEDSEAVTPGAKRGRPRAKVVSLKLPA